MLKYLYLIIVLCLTGCGYDPEEDYETTVGDLLGKKFLSGDEYAYTTKKHTTDITFYNDSTFLIEEKMWRVNNGSVSWYKDPNGNIVKQRFVGKIVDVQNCTDNQVILLNIRRLNMDGAEVLGGYKDYLITYGTSCGEYAIVLIEVAEQQYWNSTIERYSYKWVPLRDGDTTWLIEY